jgi:hypothetical protein
MLRNTIITALILCPTYLLGHGGVVLDDDVCLIKMGFLTAHFTIYQPDTRDNEEFCESIPDAANSLFILDYNHKALSGMPIEFRIIKDEQNLGIFAKLEDVDAIENINEVTVFYRPQEATNTSSLSISHRFDEKGWYIGIVKVFNPESGRIYETAFPFEVGKNYTFPILFILLALMLQIIYFQLQKRGKHLD